MSEPAGGPSELSAAEFRSLKAQWQSSALAGFLVRHVLCVGTSNHEPVVTAWLDEADRLRCWCRSHGEAIELPDNEPVGTRHFWLSVSVGVAMENQWMFQEDPTGAMVAEYVNRLWRVLQWASLLSLAGRDGVIH